MADEVQTFKALITIHKVLQEGHPITVKEAQQHVNWVESLARGVTGEGLRGMRSLSKVVDAVCNACRTESGLTRCRLRPSHPGIRLFSPSEAPVP